jgi:hypothetical protein
MRPDMTVGSCLDYVDSDVQALALRAITQFFDVGENEDLREVGKALPPHFDAFRQSSATRVSARQAVRLRSSRAMPEDGRAGD